MSNETKTYRGYTINDARQVGGEFCTKAYLPTGSYMTCGISTESQEQARQNCLDCLDVLPTAAEVVSSARGAGSKVARTPMLHHNASLSEARA